MKKYIKINEDDLKMAEEYFQNDRQFDEFLLNVFRYYRGKPLVFRTKNVKKFFNIYKRTMDFVIAAHQHGKKGIEKQIDNEEIKSDTPTGYPTGYPQPTPTGTPPVNNIIVNNKIVNNKISKKENNKIEVAIYSNIFDEFLDKNCPTIRKLKNQLSNDQAENLNQEFGYQAVIEIFESMENYQDLQKRYKSVYLTAKNWLKQRKTTQNNNGSKQSFTDHAKQWLEKTSQNSVFGK